MMKAVIFDLNGVLIQSPKLSGRFQVKFGIPAEKFLLALKDIMAKVRKPDAGDSFIYWARYLKEWNVNLNKREFFDFWFLPEKEAPDLIDLAKKIKEKGIKIFILSNNFSERAQYYKENFPFLKIFDKIYYSWQTGFVKPDTRALENLLFENNLKPEECLYFDNSKENIEAAKGLGIKSFLFSDVDSLKKVLAEFRVIT